MPEIIEEVKSNLGLYVNLTLRSLLLGGLIFLAATYIPSTPLSLEIRATIAIVVVLIYSLLDLVASLLVAGKIKACEWICGCGPSDGTDIKLTF